MAALSPSRVPLLIMLVAGCGTRAAANDAGDDANTMNGSGGSSGTGDTSDPGDTSDSNDTSDSDDADDSDDSSDTGSGFLTGYDLPGGGCSSLKLSPCDPLAQDCPDGEKCVPYDSTCSDEIEDYFTKCVPVLGDQAPGEPCVSTGPTDANDDCHEHSFCWDVVEQDDELVGTCKLFCTGYANAPSCPDNHECVISHQGSVIYCEPVCDPLDHDCPNET